MKPLHPPILLALLACSISTSPARALNPYIAHQNITWTTLGQNENDSMPLGNGDLAANVWTEQSGDILALLAKSDAWTETGKLVKLGRLRINLTPNPFANATDFSQTLNLQTATLLIKSGNNTIQIWADANHSAIHLQAHLAQPAALHVTAEFWRKTEMSNAPHPTIDYSRIMTGNAAPASEPDTLFPASPDRIAWCHFNPSSYYPYLLKQEQLESALPKYPDPLLHRCFGVALLGPGLVTLNDRSLQSSSPSKNPQLDIVAHSAKQIASPEAWKTELDTYADEISRQNLDAVKSAHDLWWQNFWNRSWIHVTGNDDADNVTQGYSIQRYMIASSSRGELPPKFNGGLFTVGHDSPASTKPSKTDHDPDYRAWGDSYWNQNNRLLYWPLIATGDGDLLQPWFNMYLNALPLATDRTQIYYHHPGAHFPETMLFWGLPNLHDFGEHNPTNIIQSAWQRYHIQGSLEVIAQMLDLYDSTDDDAFAQHSLIPFADAIVTFYDQHYPRGAAGKITMAPAQSLETYQLTAINPTPDIAGLQSILPRLLALPHTLTTDAQRSAWTRTLNDLPPIPIGKTAHGKVPPLALGDPDGTPTILPAQHYDKTGNSENPQLYVVFPYRLYGVGKPNLQLARDTFAARRSPQDTCWGQDGTQAAVLGLTATAQKAAIDEFTDYGDQRFKWFWKPGHDWIPDLDNGGDGMITLQLMLMQCDGNRITLLPAWPPNWNADFKLQAPHQTTIEAHIQNGHLQNLKVTPESRTKDVVILPVAQELSK